MNDEKVTSCPGICACTGGGCKREEHTHKAEKKTRFLLCIAIAASLVVVAFLLDNVLNQVLAASILFGAAVLLSGYPVFWGGFKSLARFKFTEEVLMTLAVIAAVCIGEFMEAALVTVLFALGNYLEGLAENRSRRDIKKLVEIRPDIAHRMVREETETVPAQQVLVGDLIAIYPHELVPLDGVVAAGSSMLDSSPLTGESVPVPAETGTTVLSGMINGNGTLQVRVLNNFQNSAASRIIEMVSEAADRKGKTEKLITRFARVYTPIVTILAVLVAALPPLLGAGAFLDWLHRGLVFLVASCPCALVISVPLGIFSGTGVAAKHGILIKGGKYLEALSRTDAVAFDKTGTLTGGRLSVASVQSVGQAFSLQKIVQYAASAEQVSTHPVARAMIDKAEAENVPLLPAADVTEIGGYGVQAMVEGHAVACGQKKLMERNGIPLPASVQGSVFLAIDGVLTGTFVMMDEPRKDAKESVDRLRELGIQRVTMLTGDQEEAARAVAQACGVTDYFSQLLPEDKVEKLQKIKEESGTLTFVGDGINDAPALAVADCGIAMGFGTDAAAEAADVVLASESLLKIPAGIRLARKVMQVVRFNIVFALAIKFFVLLLAVLGEAPMWAAVFADVGVTVITVLNATRILKFRLPG